MQQLIKTIFSLSKDIRYVAVYTDGKLTSSDKQGVAAASSSESDKYEELIVNPTILTLAKQRGNIDCGGAEFVLIRYGNFYQFVVPMQNGHVSVCIEPHADPLKLAEPIQSALNRHSNL
jgi:hypothetical protein